MAPAPDLCSRRPLVVVSYNIHGCLGTDGRQSPGRVAEVIRRLDPDIVGLQEVWGHADAAGAVDQLSFLADALGMAPVAGPNLVRQGVPYGNALLTRRPVLGSRRIDLGVGGREPRCAIDALLDLAAGPLRVIVTHLGLGLLERFRQRARLAAAIAESNGPLVLLGDLNGWLPFSGCPLPVMGLSSCAGSPRSYPSRFPLLPLDRVLARPARSVVDTAACDTALSRLASDHLPVWATLELAPAGAPRRPGRAPGRRFARRTGGAGAAGR
jgi:endonuclease/exonuclease/phosphatase family metal-dependent hydrolase